MNLQNRGTALLARLVTPASWPWPGLPGDAAIRRSRWIVGTVGFPLLMTVADHTHYLLDGGASACLADLKGMPDSHFPLFSCKDHGFADPFKLVLFAAFHLFLILPATLALRSWLLPHTWVRRALTLFAMLAAIPKGTLHTFSIPISDITLLKSFVLAICLTVAAILPARRSHS